MEKLTPQLIESKIDDFMTRHSGFELRRNYLSISHIAGCPRQAVREYKEGYEVQEYSHRMAFAGYEMEVGVRAILEAEEVADPSSRYMEVVAPFDERLKGHLDGLTVDGDIIEIKSVSRSQFKKIEEKGKVLWSHFVQTQLYMRYSGRKLAFVVYRCRDNYEYKVLELRYQEKMAAEFEDRARRILAAIDNDTILECECARCGVK